MERIHISGAASSGDQGRAQDQTCAVLLDEEEEELRRLVRMRMRKRRKRRDREGG
jgi:hypothetical protein